MVTTHSLDQAVREIGDTLASHLGFALCRHGIMLFPKSDQYVGQSLSLYGEFSEAEVALFNLIVPRGSVVVEVGANLGAHTISLAQRVGPEGRVYAFEPQSFLHNILCANMALNGHDNVRCFNLGVGRERGTMSLPPIDYERFNNFGAFSLSTNPGIPVDITTLDTYTFTRLDFIKIDVEGMEKDVLDGARNTINRHRPLLYVENDREEKSEALIRTIMDLGYRLWWHLPTLYNPDNFRQNANNIFPSIVSFNMLCLPQSMTANIEFPEITDPTHGKQYAVDHYKF
jgi:FkbM family methyltransferase